MSKCVYICSGILNHQGNSKNHKFKIWLIQVSNPGLRGHWLGCPTPQPLDQSGVENEREIWKYKLERPYSFQSPGRNVQTITAHFNFDCVVFVTVVFAQNLKKSKMLLGTYKFKHYYFEGSWSICAHFQVLKLNFKKVIDLSMFIYICHVPTLTFCHAVTKMSHDMFM